MPTYEKLKAQVQELRSRGEIGEWPTREQRIDWAFGNSKIENDGVTREMAEKAVDEKPTGHE